MERLVTLGIAVNLVVYLTKTMHLGNANAANIVTNFMGTSYILTLLGGYIADTFIGRLVRSSIYKQFSILCAAVRPNSVFFKFIYEKLVMFS